MLRITCSAWSVARVARSAWPWRARISARELSTPGLLGGVGDGAGRLFGSIRLPALGESDDKSTERAASKESVLPGTWGCGRW